MFRVRPSLARMAAAAAAAAACISCLATAAQAGTVASGSTGRDPLAGLSASKVSAEALANLKAAPSLKMAGTLYDSGAKYTLSLGIKPGRGCTGTLGTGGKGSFKLIVIGRTVYFNPDVKFWESAAGKNAAAIIKLVHGRYIKTSTSDKDMATVATVCDISNAIASVKVTGAAAKGALTTVGGIRVLPLRYSGGSVMDVTDTSKPEAVAIGGPKGTATGDGTLTFSVGARVTLTAPPASQVINGSTLGI
jgi:hypothetical protein